MVKFTRTNHGPPVWEIAEIQVAGFKSIRAEQSIEIHPLTILAGANSAGKSSMMQPLLLLKQTLESSFDAGALLLNGPNVKFTSADQILARNGEGRSVASFCVGLRLNTGWDFKAHYRKDQKVGFRIERMELSDWSGAFTLWPGMSPAEIVQSRITDGKNALTSGPPGHSHGRWTIRRSRCFVELSWVADGRNGTFTATDPVAAIWESVIPEIIYLPGSRRNPERAFPVTAIGPTYPGPFAIYPASIIAHWMTEAKNVLADLNAELKLLNLTAGVIARHVNDAEIEIHVGRVPEVPPTRPGDWVNIADVGVGVSEVLPVLVALHAARPGQLVYIEQPETHLHPRAQFDLAQILAAAAKRGVRVVVETHSSILLLGVQTLVAEGSLDQDKVKLHWFERKNGRTTVRTGDLDDAGAFGDWPVDFDDTTLRVQKRYLDAADKRLFAR